MSNGRWIGVDLDGTIAHYDGWRGIEHIGEPIAPMVKRVTKWLSEGIEVRIFTARVDGGQSAAALGLPGSGAYRDVSAVKRPIEEWCLKHIGMVLPITNVKDFGMIELWDDRAVRVEFNTGRIIVPTPAPRAWLRISKINGEVTGVFLTNNVELRSEYLEPLYSLSD